MSKSVECKCTSNFTCGYCLHNAKPWHFTLSDGSAIYSAPIIVDNCMDSTESAHATEVSLERGFC